MREGVVAVFGNVKRRTIVLRAGQTYLAKPAARATAKAKAKKPAKPPAKAKKRATRR